MICSAGCGGLSGEFEPRFVGAWTENGRNGLGRGSLRVYRETWEHATPKTPTEQVVCVRWWLVFIGTTATYNRVLFTPVICPTYYASFLYRIEHSIALALACFVYDRA